MTQNQTLFKSQLNLLNKINVCAGQAETGRPKFTRSPVVTRAHSKAMAEQTSPQMKTEEKTVSKTAFLALQGKVEALREMVQSLLLEQSLKEEQPVLTQPNQFIRVPKTGAFPNIHSARTGAKTLSDAPHTGQNLLAFNMGNEANPSSVKPTITFPIHADVPHDTEASQHDNIHPGYKHSTPQHGYFQQTLTEPVGPTEDIFQHPETTQRLKNLEETLKAIQGSTAYIPTGFSDLCFFPDLKFPPKFKIPDFPKFDGTGDPRVHLRLYTGSLTGIPEPEKYMMQFFQHSLTGAALTWFGRLDFSRIPD